MPSFHFLPSCGAFFFLKGEEQNLDKKLIIKAEAKPRETKDGYWGEGGSCCKRAAGVGVGLPFQMWLLYNTGKPGSGKESAKVSTSCSRDLSSPRYFCSVTNFSLNSFRVALGLMSLWTCKVSSIPVWGKRDTCLSRSTSLKQDRNRVNLEGCPIPPCGMMKSLGGKKRGIHLAGLCL